MAAKRPGTVARVAAAIVVGGCALTAAACGSGTPRASTTTVPQAGPTATVRIGFIGALSGPSGGVGSAIANGEKLAISQFDAVDPPVKVALDVADTAGDPAAVRAAAMKLVADRVVALIGPTQGAEALVADPVFEQAGIPSVTVSAAETDLAGRGWRFFHRVIPDGSLQGQADGDFLVKDLHAATVAVIYDSSTPSREISVSAQEAVAGAGARVVSSDHIDGRPADLASVVERVMAAPPDVVFFTGAAVTAGQLVERLQTAGFSGRFLGGVSDAGEFLAAAGPAAAEGSYLACACTSTTDNPDAQAFNAAYLAQFGSSPGAWSAEAYDATNALLKAIKSGDMTPAAVNGFLATVDYSGITRTIKFMPDGDWAGQTVYIFKVESGQVVQVATSGST